MASLQFIFPAQQLESLRVTGTLVDDTNTAIPLASLNTITATLYNATVDEPNPTTGNIINSRNGQDIKNANGVTIHATSGAFTWEMAPADHPIVDTTQPEELHVALITWTYNSDPVKTGREEIGFRVENLRKV